MRSSVAIASEQGISRTRVAVFMSRDYYDVDVFAIGWVFQLHDMARVCLVNQNADVGRHDASLVEQNDVCYSAIERLENDRAIASRKNVDNIWISDQHRFEWPLKQESRLSTEP